MGSVTQRDASKGEQARKPKAVPVGFAVGPHGKPFKCSMARHLSDPAAHSLYETIARLTNLGQSEKENEEIYRKEGPCEAFERGHLFASLRVLADASGMSVNWVRKHLATLKKKGFIIALDDERTPSELGRFQTINFEVLTHFEMALRRDACPSCRFDADGNLTRRRVSADFSRRFQQKKPRSKSRTCATTVA